MEFYATGLYEDYTQCNMSGSSSYSDTNESGIDLSDFSSEISCSDSSAGASFVEELLDEIADKQAFSVIDCSASCQADGNYLNEYNCPSNASSCTTSNSYDVSYESLDDCSASLSTFLDPNDLNALLDTLSESLPRDLLASPVILDDACYSLFQCIDNEHSTTPVLTNDGNETRHIETPDPVKPDISYIELVAKAIMSSPDNSILLADIYSWIEDNFPYYKHTKNSWRNSIRHNLSVNECFVKSKRVKNGRGFYWSIHSSCIDAFNQGDFDRRKARRQVQQCNRAFSSALDEMKQLTQNKHFQSKYVTPISSTPLRNSHHPYYYGSSMQQLHHGEYP